MVQTNFLYETIELDTVLLRNPQLLPAAGAPAAKAIDHFFLADVLLRFFQATLLKTFQFWRCLGLDFSHWEFAHHLSSF